MRELYIKANKFNLESKEKIYNADFYKTPGTNISSNFIPSFLNLENQNFNEVDKLNIEKIGFLSPICKYQYVK